MKSDTAPGSGNMQDSTVIQKAAPSLLAVAGVTGLWVTMVFTNARTSPLLMWFFFAVMTAAAMGQTWWSRHSRNSTTPAGDARRHQTTTKGEVLVSIRRRCGPHRGPYARCPSSGLKPTSLIIGAERGAPWRT